VIRPFKLAPQFGQKLAFISESEVPQFGQNRGMINLYDFMVDEKSLDLKRRTKKTIRVVHFNPEW
jgi:hypothetical protein